MNSNILFSLRNKQSRLFLNKASALKLDSERVLFLFRVSGIPFLVSEKGDIISARPYGGIQGVRWAGRCGERIERRRWRMKRDERVAAVKILSVRRKAARKFWAPQQDHRPLRVHDKRCGVKRNPPVTASPCQPPLGKGAEGTGGRIATASLRTGLAMTGGFTWGAVDARAGGQGASAPTEMSEHLRRAACPHAAVMVRWLTGGGLRAARPTEAYFAVRRGGALPLPYAPQGSPLRRVASSTGRGTMWGAK